MTSESTLAPSVVPPWIRQWDDSKNAWRFTNTSTGDRTYDYDYNLMNTSNQGAGYAAQYTSDMQKPLSSAAQSVQNAPEKFAYGFGEAVDQANAYEDGVGGTVEGVKDSVADWVSAAADAVGRDIEQGLSDITDAPDTAVHAVGEGVQNAEQLGEDVGEAIADAPEKVAEEVREGAADVQRFGEDMGDAAAQVPEDAMRKIGEGVDDVQEVGEDVQRYGGSLGQAYEQGKEEERYE